MLRIILTVVQVFSAVSIVGLVLLQRGKGADAGAGFGAGASGTVFGARGATTALSRATAIFAAIFMINSLTLAYMGAQAADAPKSIFDRTARPNDTDKAATAGKDNTAAPAPGAATAPPTTSGSAPAPTQPPGGAPPPK